MRDRIQEARELGAGGTAFRLGWEALTRLGLRGRTVRPSPPNGELRLEALPFAPPAAVASAVRDRIPRASREALLATAEAAAGGQVLCFSATPADLSERIDWHRDPRTGAAWDPNTWWSRALRRPVGDVKWAWEPARFPQAFHFARAAAFEPSRAPAFSEALEAQIESFLRATPFGRGIHWASGQEVAVRLLAWSFALHALPLAPSLRARLADAFAEGATHIDAQIVFARRGVPNNHLLAEAGCLLWVAALLPQAGPAARWRERGRALLSEGVERQFDRDGAYVQLSHTYHRVALQVLLLAIALDRPRAPAAWIDAVARSLEFLVAQQNQADGRLPNFGANDGALPLPLSTCAYPDMRPTLQACALIARGERLYPPGPWDELAAWLLGPESLQAPLVPPLRRSRSFPSGFHVLRQSPSDFAVLRCGTARERFSQIDMLHVDVWWRGQNVLIDPGSFVYNGAPAWQAHFHRTASHNALTVDGQDQMLHHRPFKNLYPTPAGLLAFVPDGLPSRVDGEHTGYRRLPGGVVHRRTVLAWRDLWVVIDRVGSEASDTSPRDLRLHWQGGPFPFRPSALGLMLETPLGPFSVDVYDSEGRPLPGTVVSGQASPPRGWSSRTYGHKVAAPSLAVERRVALPATFVSVLGSGDPVLRADGGALVVERGRAAFRFDLTLT